MRKHIQLTEQYVSGSIQRSDIRRKSPQCPRNARFDVTYSQSERSGKDKNTCPYWELKAGRLFRNQSLH